MEETSTIYWPRHLEIIENYALQVAHWDSIQFGGAADFFIEFDMVQWVFCGQTHDTDYA